MPLRQAFYGVAASALGGGIGCRSSEYGYLVASCVFGIAGALFSAIDADQLDAKWTLSQAVRVFALGPG